MFAIMNKRSKKFVCSTDYKGDKPKQHLSKDEAKTYLTYKDAKKDFKRRGCGKDYAICELEPLKFASWAIEEATN